MRMPRPHRTSRYLVQVLRSLEAQKRPELGSRTPDLLLSSVHNTILFTCRQNVLMELEHSEPAQVSRTVARSPPPGSPPGWPQQ